MSDKVKLTTWVRPPSVEGGEPTEIKLNDEPATVAKAQELGWKRKAGRPAKDAA